MATAEEKAALETWEKAVAIAWEAYDKAIGEAREAREKATAVAWRVLEGRA